MVHCTIIPKQFIGERERKGEREEGKEEGSQEGREEGREEEIQCI